MKVISIKHNRLNPLNYRLHLGFLEKLEKVCDYESIVAYDKKEKKILITPDKIVSKYKPDIVICNAHSPILEGYFRKMSCLKVMIAVDTHKHDRLPFYKSNNFNLILNRGYFDDSIEFPRVWFPFSVDHNEFYPTKERRIKRIGFVGTYKPGIYKQRRNAINKLDKEGLLINGGKIIGEDYSKFLRKHIGILSPIVIKNGPHAKLFEIMASGTLALVSNFEGKSILFKPNDFVVYKKDCSNVVEKAKWILNNSKQSKEIAINGLKTIKERHTDDIRIKELYGHLNNMLEGKELVERWKE